MSKAEDMPNPPYGAPASAWTISAGMPSARSRPAITSAELWSFAWRIRTAATSPSLQGTGQGGPLYGLLTRPDVAGRCSSGTDRARAPVESVLHGALRPEGGGRLRPVRRQRFPPDPRRPALVGRQAGHPRGARRTARARGDPAERPRGRHADRRRPDEVPRRAPEARLERGLDRP